MIHILHFHNLHFPEPLVKLLDEKDAIVHLCGDAKGMAKDVSQAFVQILCQVKGNCSLVIRRFYVVSAVCLP